ncbi:MAG TPA: 30S ribosomal protein S18 [Gaiellaceae bacterium]
MAGRAKRGETGQRPAPPGNRKGGKLARRKSCFFCREQIAEVDYKNVGQLRRSISDRAKIKSRTNTGTCRKHQRQVAVAIKRAREMALLPYTGDAQASQPGSSSRRSA